MTTPTAWRTDEPCPVCATGLILLDDGTDQRTECRLCGWSDTWASDNRMIVVPTTRIGVASD